MSSHREAPEIAKDPAADSTDLYAFVSPGRPKTITVIANYIPLQAPDGGPNFFEFADDVEYRINIDNNGDGLADVSYRFNFQTHVRNPNTFLYNTGPITSIDSPNWNRPQFYSVTRHHRGAGAGRFLGEHLSVPPVNVGVRSTPNYAATFTKHAIHRLGAHRVFAGQRADAFFVDLGSIFDLGALRPFNEAHLIPMPNAAGVNGLQGFNVHSIALQIPISAVTRDGSVPTDPMSHKAVLGIWTSAHRHASRVFHDGTWKSHGRPVQVSRLGMPLFNEVIVPMSRKDEWNAQHPVQDKEYAKFVQHPELQALLPVLYPGVFPNLAAYKKPRIDLEAILLTGIPGGIVPGFQNFTGSTLADMLRLNVAIPPSDNPNDLGLLGGDAAGFPNGRRVNDNIVTAELRAIAGVTIPLVDSSYEPDGAASAVQDGTTNTNPKTHNRFPYLGAPAGGYQSTPGEPHV
jgi:uncharacterized protein DUF4331